MLTLLREKNVSFYVYSMANLVDQSTLETLRTLIQIANFSQMLIQKDQNFYLKIKNMITTCILILTG